LTRCTILDIFKASIPISCTFRAVLSIIFTTQPPTSKENCICDNWNLFIEMSSRPNLLFESLEAASSFPFQVCSNKVAIAMAIRTASSPPIAMIPTIARGKPLRSNALEVYQRYEVRLILYPNFIKDFLDVALCQSQQGQQALRRYTRQARLEQ